MEVIVDLLISCINRLGIRDWRSVWVERVGDSRRMMIRRHDKRVWCFGTIALSRLSDRIRNLQVDIIWLDYFVLCFDEAMLACATCKIGIVSALRGIDGPIVLYTHAAS